MRSVSKTFIAASLLLLTLGIFFLMFNHPKPAPTPAPEVQQETSSVNDYVEQVSRERELEQERHYDERKQVKLAMTKKNSVECQFWMQQKPSKKSEEKIAQHCGAPQAAQDAASSPAKNPDDKTVQ